MAALKEQAKSVDYRLSTFKRITVKIGSSLLVDRQTHTLKRDWLETLADDLASLAKGGADLVIVSSGSIALGREVLGLGTRPAKLEDAQAAAAVGQIALARAYAEALGARGMVAGQVLLTLEDTESRRRYLNARATMETLFGHNAIPVVNENDTVATTEIRYGDNDRLAARVATMVSADCLVLLSDIDGLYTAPPGRDTHATHLSFVPGITRDIEAMAGGEGSDLSRGGMRTKIDAGKIATKGGAAMVIASGKGHHPLAAIDQGARATWFAAEGNPVTARKRWIAGSLDAPGALYLDAGAVRALENGKSLLSPGIVRSEGRFHRGDAVRVLGPDGAEIGRGLVAYDSTEVAKIAGRQSHEIEALIGYQGRRAVIHRDELALTRAGKAVE